MNQNTSSPTELARSTGTHGVPAGLERLSAAIDELAACDPSELGDALLAAKTLGLHRLGDRLEAVTLRFLAVVDGRGAAGAEQGTQAASTVGWLRASLRMGAAAAGRAVRTARALYRGPLAGTARALAQGEVSYAHAAVLADATSDLPPAKVKEAEPVLLEAADRLDPPGLRRLGTHLREVIDPERAEEREWARLERRGLWLSHTFEGLLDVHGLLDPEAGEAVQAALLPLARPAGPDDERSAAQRRADALGELAGRALQAGNLPQAGGVRPQVAVTVELEGLRAGPAGSVGGVGTWGATLSGEAARRLACDAAVTRAIVRRRPHHPDHDGHATGDGRPGTGDTGPGGCRPADGSTGNGGGLAARLRGAVTLLPPPLGAPLELLELGRATRTISPGLRRALATRDGGCAAPGCDRPPPWADAHHLDHWADGGTTDLDNLVLLCRHHHLAVHEGGWQLGRDPGSGQVILAPPVRRGHSPPAA